jgi:endogenous inhibitor of DNA gyrase (YacG/DUF329 family)
MEENSNNVNSETPVVRPATEFDIFAPTPDINVQATHTSLCPTCNQHVQINVDLNRKCPQCQKQVVIRQNRSNRENFIACSGYPSCRWTMSIRNYLRWTEPKPPPSNDGDDRKIFI